MLNRFIFLVLRLRIIAKLNVLQSPVSPYEPNRNDNPATADYLVASFLGGRGSQSTMSRQSSPMEAQLKARRLT